MTGWRFLIGHIFEFERSALFVAGAIASFSWIAVCQARGVSSDLMLIGLPVTVSIAILIYILLRVHHFCKAIRSITLHEMTHCADIGS